MSIKICCTEEDGIKNYGSHYLSMEKTLKENSIRKYLGGYEFKLWAKDWDSAPQIFYCPFCGAKITEEKEKPLVYRQAIESIKKILDEMEE